MRKRILITGINGFIGSALQKFILAKRLPFEVVGKKVIRCDFTHQSKLFDILVSVNPDYIFHLAGGRKGNVHEIMQSNVQTSRVLFESVLKLKNCRPRIVIPGSAAEYGFSPPSIKLVTEKLSPQPNSWYGFVKHMQTSLGLMYARKGLDIVVARLFNISGTGVSPNLVVGKFAKEISMIEKGIKPPQLKTGNLKGKRDFLDIEDVCRGLVAIAHRGKRGEIYNLCSGHSQVIGEVLEKLLSFSKVKNIVVKEENEDISHSHDTIGSNAKIERISTWRPQVTIEESLRKSLDYYRDANPHCP